VRRLVPFLAVLAAIAASPPAASAAPTPPLSNAGKWITDADGRVVLLHGVNMVYKRPPYHADATGFGADDARFLRREGLNTVRLGIIYKALEPRPGVYSGAYLDRIERTVEALSREGIFTQLDFHQDLYNERFQGEGFPDWAVQDDGLPAQPRLGFPANYLAMPALSRAFDHFWDNDPGPGGIGLQDRYAAAFRLVAERFRGERRLLGYDLFNEPWPGSGYALCIRSAAAPSTRS
jgi:endoglycosylceramidase